MGVAFGLISFGLLFCKMGLITPACLSQWLWMKEMLPWMEKLLNLKLQKVIEASVLSLTLPEGKRVYFAS